MQAGEHDRDDRQEPEQPALAGVAVGGEEGHRADGRDAEGERLLVGRGGQRHAPRHPFVVREHRPPDDHHDVARDVPGQQ